MLKILETHYVIVLFREEGVRVSVRTRGPYSYKMGLVRGADTENRNQNVNILKSLTIMISFAKFYVIIRLWRLPNRCPKREIMILWKDILI